MNLQDLNDVQSELIRLNKKIDSLKARCKKEKEIKWGIDPFMGSKESGAVKRSAMDLKNELTKLTR